MVDTNMPILRQDRMLSRVMFMLSPSSASGLGNSQTTGNTQTTGSPPPRGPGTPSLMYPPPALQPPATARPANLRHRRRLGALLAMVMGAISWPLGAVEMELRVHCRGAGEPVYLVGGGPAFTSRNLEPLPQMLSAGYRVCRWDMRGVGDNAGVPFATGQDQLEAWLADMARLLPRQPVILWGQSWGALQVLLFARRHPTRVKGLVLSNPVDPELVSLEHIENKRHVHAIPQADPALQDMDTIDERRLA